jgi:hypothetical protein
MTYHDARIIVASTIEENIEDDSKSAALIAAPDYMERQISSLLQAVTRADPKGEQPDRQVEAIENWVGSWAPEAA